MGRKWKPASSNPDEFERQFAAASEAGILAGGPRATEARFDPATGAVSVGLRDGLGFSFPAAHYPELADRSAAQLEDLRVTASGLGLHWAAADVHLSVPQVVAELFGRYGAQHSGRQGGKSRSPAKAQAARRNARLGGRPAARTEVVNGPGMMQVHARAGACQRSVDVCIGSEYVVEPLNPAARKNRGRRGRVVAFEDVKDGRVRFRFFETGRVGLIDPADLLPVREPGSSAD
jgi:hypothetical protein